MIRLLVAEHLWLVRRRPLRLAALLAAVCATALPVVRQVHSSTDVSRALADAERDAAVALAQGVDIPLEHLYVEPRYQLAVQLPVDVAALALGLAVMMLVTSAVAVGSEWRSGTVRLSWVTPEARSVPAAVRVTVWWAAGTVVGAAALLLCCAGLLIVGHLGGLSDGVSAVAAAGVVVRGALLVGAASAVGAATATVCRSDVAVLTVVLTYVIVVEMLVVGLRTGQGYQSPGAQAFTLVGGVRPGVSPEVETVCSPAPRCSVVLEPLWGEPRTYWAVGLALVCLVLVAAWSARRPWWR